MITRFLTDVRVTFNPFSPRSKPARLFLSLIPSDARANGMKIEHKMLPRTSKEIATLGVKFSTFDPPGRIRYPCISPKVI
jgi:large subunit ribosomal protein L53